MFLLKNTVISMGKGKDRHPLRLMEQGIRHAGQSEASK